MDNKDIDEIREQIEWVEKMLELGHVPECINRIATYGGDCYCEYFGFIRKDE